MPRVRPQRQRVAQPTSIPAPVGGWNARDSIAAMPVTDATEMVNWFPYPDKVSVRKGSQVFLAAGLLGTGGGECLFEWSGPTSKKLITVTGNGPFAYADITTGAVVAIAGPGVSDAKVQGTQIRTPGGSFLVTCNGVELPAVYNGVLNVAMAITGPAGLGAEFIHVCLYRFRLFFVEKNTLNVWYLPPNSIGGAAKKLDFSSLCKRGGTMRAMGTWTQDGAEGGADDLAAFLTSEGELLIYSGADPSSASSWRLQGIYQVGRPLGRRCMLRFGADLCMILEDGFYSIQQLMTQNVSKPALALSDKIRSAFAQASGVAFNGFGWEAVYHPRGQMLLVNVPQQTLTSAGYKAEQYVMNSISNSWARFTGQDAMTWCVYDGGLYYTRQDSSGVRSVLLASTGSFDYNVSPIEVSAAQAFFGFGNAGQTKYFTMFRPKMQSDGIININPIIEVDYTAAYASVTGTSVTGSDAFWNTATWDVTAWWTSDITSTTDWYTYGATGHVGRVRLATLCSANLSWFDTDFLIEPGEVL